MSHARTRSLAAAAVAGALLLPMSACGAEHKSAANTGVTAVTAAHLTRDNFGDRMLSGIRKFKSAHLSLKLGSAMSAEGDAEYGGQGSAMTMTVGMGGGGGAAKVIFVDDVLYLQVPGMTAPGKWTKVSKDDAALGKLVRSFTKVSPQGAVELMRKGLKDVTYVGPDTIDGEAVTAYRVTADTSKALASLGQLGLPAGKAPRTVTYDLFVTKDDLIRRVRADVSGQKLVLDVTKWGERVSIQAPAAGDVAAMPSMPSMSSM